VSRAAPEEIAAALARLARAGERLRRRPAREALAALARVLDALADPASAPRRALEAQLPAATGFSPEVVREGLARALAAWRGEALLALVERELGGPDALDGRGHRVVSGFETTAVVLAGALPTPSVLALVAPLALRSPVLAKTASHDPVTAPRLVRALSDSDPELGACAEVVQFPGADAACAEALCAAGCVVATGSDETVAALAARVRPPRRLVAHGHALSVAALGPAAAPDAAERLALDVALWDQLGCLSPLAVYAVGASEPAEALAAALAAAEARLPRGRAAPEAEALAAHERAAAELRGAALWTGAGGRWSVVREADACWRPAPLHRFVRVHPVPDAAGLLDALRPLGPHLACVALEGFGPDGPALAAACAGLGASRVCAPGAMQAPPLDWPRGGRGVLAPLARFAGLR
jgi:hypothetical protein